MRILVVADLHYGLKQFDWVSSVAGEYSLVVVAGDLLDLAGYADLDTQIVVVLKYLDLIRSQAPLIVSSGNHDGDAKNEKDEFIAQWLQRTRGENLHVDGDSVTISGDLFTVCPWWDGPVTREAMCASIDAEREKPRKRWFSPPDRSTTSWTGKKYFGKAYIRTDPSVCSPITVLGDGAGGGIFSGLANSHGFEPPTSWSVGGFEPLASSRNSLYCSTQGVITHCKYCINLLVISYRCG